MYQCDRCKAMFEEDEAETKTFCYESEFGVSGLFPDRHYGSYIVCPECGSNELTELYCDEHCGFCGHYAECTLDIRKEDIVEYYEDVED